MDIQLDTIGYIIYHWIWKLQLDVHHSAELDNK